MCVIYQLIIVPFRFCFDLNLKQNNIENYIEIVIDCLFILDIILNFNTTFYNEELRKKDYSYYNIFINYIKKWFIFDLITSIPYDKFLIQDEITDSRYAKLYDYNLLKILKIVRVLRIGRIIQITNKTKVKNFFFKLENIYLSDIQILILKILGIFISILLICHFFTCFWILVGNVGLKNNNYSWITFNNFNNLDNYELYVVAYYNMINTFTCVGFGEIYPVSIEERIFNMLILLISKAIFSYILASIFIYFETIKNQNLDDLILIHNKIKKFMVNRNVDSDLRQSIVAYFNYIEYQKSFVKIDENIINTIINPRLKSIVLESIHENIVKSIPYIGNSDIVIKLLSKKIVEINIPPNHYVYKMNSESNSIYYVIKGTFDEVDCRTQLIFKDYTDKIGENIIFGMYEFLGKIPRITGIIATKYSSIFTLSRSDIKESILKIDDLTEINVENESSNLKSDILNSRKEVVSILKNLEKLRISIVKRDSNIENYSYECYICKEKNHHYCTECPLLTYPKTISKLKLHNFLSVNSYESAVLDESKILSICKYYTNAFKKKIKQSEKIIMNESENINKIELLRKNLEDKKNKKSTKNIKNIDNLNKLDKKDQSYELSNKSSIEIDKKSNYDHSFLESYYTGTVIEEDLN